MLIEICEDIVLAAEKNKKSAISVLEKISFAYKYGKHIIYVKYPLLIRITKIQNLSKAVRNLYSELKSKNTFLGSIYDAVNLKTKITYSDLSHREQDLIIINPDEDVLTQICMHYLKTSQCPRYMSHEKVQERRDYVKQLVDEYHADGVMYEQLKFCEYWGYERALASYVMTNDYGVPTAAVDRQYTASASGQLRTRVQAFVESLEIKKIQKERQAKENG